MNRVNGAVRVCSRRGMTLVEILVVALLGVTVTGMLFVVQQSTSRRSVTTDHKRDAMIKTHRAYQLVHSVLASSPRFDATGSAGTEEADDDDFDEDQPKKPTSSGVTTPRGAISFDPKRGRLTVRKTSIDGIGAVQFYPAPDGLLVAFTVDSGTAAHDRERSQLYGKHYFEPERDRRHFKAWADQPETAAAGKLGAGGFVSTCGYSVPGAGQ